jgi:hypothetical protein
LRKCWFSIDFESKGFIRNYIINEIEQRARTMDVHMNNVLEKKDMFYDGLILNLENVTMIQNNDNQNMDLRETIIIMEANNFDEGNEEENDEVSSDEGFCSENELNLKEECSIVEVRCLNEEKLIIKSSL